MRRTLMLLALLVAGMEGAGTPQPLATAAGAHGIAGTDGVGPAAFVRSAGGGAQATWQEGSGPGPRPLGRRRDLLAPTPLSALLSARAAACAAQAITHRAYAAPHALARAGLPAFHTTAPPPLRVV